MGDNRKLNNAKIIKNDEFYTRMEDVEDELKHHHAFLRGKFVYCPCDSMNSNFTKYFIENFNKIGLKKLVCTCLGGGYIEYNGKDLKTKSIGTGAFDSDFSLKIMDECDVVITNPPFSPVRKLYKILLERKKIFCILGTINQITGSPLNVQFIEKKVWCGFTGANRSLTFDSPEGIKIIGGITWITNIPVDRKVPFAKFSKSYIGHETEYPKYDNVDAIEVSRWKNLPDDYFGKMGVPISSIGKINYEQFNVLGFAALRGCPEKYTYRTKIYSKEEKQNYNDLNAAPTLIEDGVFRILFKRLLIQRVSVSEK